MGKYGSLSSSSSSSSSSGSTTTSSSSNVEQQNDKNNNSNHGQHWVGAGPNKTVTSGTRDSEWKPVDTAQNSSLRRRKKPIPGEEESSDQPSKASTDVSSSAGSSGKEYGDADVVQYGGDSESSESDTDSKVVKEILHGSSHEYESTGSANDETESETESMKMRRILYGSTNSSTTSKLEMSGEHFTNNESISSIGGPGTGTARRAVVPDTVNETDEEKTDDGDVAPPQKSESSNQSQSGSASVTRSLATSSRSGSTNQSPSQSRGSIRSGSASNSYSSRTPSGSPMHSRSGSTTSSSQRSKAAASRNLSQSSHPSTHAPISPQQSASQSSRTFTPKSQRSNSSSSRSHPWESNHTRTNSASRSRSTHSGTQSQHNTASNHSVSESTSVGTKENEAATEGSKSKQSSVPDPPESRGSSRNSELQHNKADQQGPGFDSSQRDLNDAVRSRESIFQPLKERRTPNDAENKELEPPLTANDEVSLSPPHKELARDPSGDLKSFTREYETGSEDDFGNEREENDLPGGEQIDETRSIPVDEVETSPTTQGSEPPIEALNSKKESSRENETETEATKVEAKIDQEEEIKTWSPVREKKNVPYTLHKIGSHDTDDWKPPALTTYGEQKFIPASRVQNAGRKDPDARNAVTAFKTLDKDSATTPILPLRPALQSDTGLRLGLEDHHQAVPPEQVEKENNFKQNKKRPPVAPPPEITLISSLDDDSSLGTYGTYLDRFPKIIKKKETKAGFTLAAVPRFAQGDSVTGGQEVKNTAALVPSFVQEDSVSGGHEVKKIVPRFAQEDSLAGGYEVKGKNEIVAQSSGAVLHSSQGVSFASVHEVEEKNKTITDNEGSFPKFVWGDAMQESAWAHQHVRPSSQQKEAADDYYRSWIHTRSEEKDLPDRLDPPGNTDLFPFNPKNPNVKIENDRFSSTIPSTPFYSGVNREAIHSSTWVPQQKKPEVCRSDSIPSLPLYYYKSERSTNSVWGAPGIQKRRGKDDVDMEARRHYIDSILSKKRPVGVSSSTFIGGSARVDYTGTISSSSPSKSFSPRSVSFLSPSPSSVTSKSGVPSLSTSNSSSASRSDGLQTSTNTPRPSKTLPSKGQHIIIQAPILGSDEAKTSHSSERELHIQRGDSGHSDAVNDASMTASQPTQSKSGTNEPPEQSIVPQSDASLKQSNVDGMRVAPYMSNTMIIAIVAAIFIILAGVGVVIYFFVVPLFQERTEPGSSPTPSPSIDSSMQGLRNLISAVSPETEVSFDDPDTPQSLALTWLSENQFLETYSLEKILQRFAMATLYYSTTGESWRRRDLWLSDTDECGWYTSETQTDVCNGNGQLDEIDLNENGLVGALPWNELAILKSQLIILDAFSNQLSGPLDSSIGKLTSLIVLDLQRNGFVGTLPREIEYLKSMRHLILAENNFSGSIPSEIAGMTDLESLNLSGNRLKGTIPDILGNMSTLRNIFLDGNGITGTVPSELCARELENLVVDCSLLVCECCTCGSGTTSPPIQSLPPAASSAPVPTPSDPSPPVSNPTDGNDLRSVVVGAFPRSRSALQDPDSPQSKALVWLESTSNDDVSTEEIFLQRYALATLYYATNGERWNDNTAWLSSTNECSWFSTATTLDVCDNFGRYLSIDLQENNLSGKIPEEIAILSNSLKTVNLRANQILGEIPPSLQDLTNVEALDLSTNNLEGAIPSELFDATNLRQLSLFENTLISTLPLDVGKLTRLELLDVGANQLTGTLPSTLGLLTRLAGLSVFGNSFTGTLPQELANSRSLQLLYIDSNDLRGPLPTDVCLLNLEEFWSDCEEMQCVCCTMCCRDGFGCFET
ncbi:RHS repeat-associated core domain containing protein [Nitzschia inconspicua]|uniref:RHS repeat-associated core domain containing protein n=1 Tax=Nitzschia inconspicua TaxID=303405 RepID=A0A9K3LX20_9STRA|nr:RHS repeat-associated core domain containing protein [Nitzschia inconspicua]